MKKVIILFLITLGIYSCNIKSPNQNSSEVNKKDEKTVELIGENLATKDDIKKIMGEDFKVEIIEHKKVFINNSANSIEIFLEKIVGWNDPGDFHKIRILSNSNEYVYYNNNGWIEYENEFYNKNNIQNVVNSKYIFIEEKTDEDILLYVFSYVYASQPGYLSIINLTTFNKPVLIYNEKSYLVSFEDINSDDINDMYINKFGFDINKNLSPFIFQKGVYIPYK